MLRKKNSTKRIGIQEVVVESIVFLDKNKQKVRGLISGDPVVIEIFSFETLKSIQIGLSIKNSVGQFVTVLSNDMAGHKFENVLGTDKLCWIIEKLPLMHDTQTITTDLIVNGIPG